MNVKTCSIPLKKCGKEKDSCWKCPLKRNCDYFWLYRLWTKYTIKAGKNSLLGPCLPAIVKANIRNNRIITITGQKDFCMFGVSLKSNYVTILDIYVADELRGKKIATKLISYLMETYDRDIFAKCVAGTSAEEFWKHVGKQIDANSDSPMEHSWYEKRPGRRDLGWYVVENKHKKQNKVELFE